MTRSLLRALSDLSSDTRASVMPLMAGVLLIGTAGAAITVDLGRAYAFRSNLQIAADSAALSAAVNLPDMDAARASAIRYASINMPGFSDLITADDIEFGHWDPETQTIEPDDRAPSALRVTARLSSAKGNAPSTLFAGVFGSKSLDIEASAAAGKRSSTCIMALEQESVDALALDFSASIEARDCTVQVNSRHERAFRVLLGSKVNAAGLCVTGGAHISPWSEVQPEVTEGCLPAVDPLAELAPPEFGGCDFHDSTYFNFHGTLQPGVYCGGLQINGLSSVTLAAGTYVIKDGPLSLAGFSEITGEEVAFFLTGDDALIRFSEMSTLTLRAPTSGDLEGILVFQDRNSVGHHIWESKAPTELYGTIYLPNGHLLSQSSNAITPVDSCNVLIAKSIRFAFRSGVSIDLGREDCRDYLPSAIMGTVALLA